MSDKTNPDQVPAVPAAEFVQRSLTPVYNYRIDGAPAFKHSGSHGSLRFDSLLRPCPPPTNWPDVAESAKPSVREEIERRVRYDSDHFGTTASHFLTTDVAGPADVGGVAWNTSYEIHALVVYGLCLHSTGGMQRHGRYSYWLPPAPYGGVNYNSYYSRQFPFPHLGRVSVLQAAAFDACRNTIDVLMRKTWGSATFDKVLLLAMEYHRLSFTLERVEHAFLILMVAFEAMFKKETEDNASKAAQRIARLLGATKRGCQGIQKEFNDDPVDSFCKIRNRIAHGDPNLNLATVESKYPSLYRHVTAAIVALLNLPPGSLDDKKDYYDEISRLTERRFLGLPNS